MNFLKHTFTCIALSSLAFFASCGDDHDHSYDVPTSYNFENASYGGQTDRLNMLAELEDYLKIANEGEVIDAAQAKAMYANVGYTWTSEAFNEG